MGRRLLAEVKANFTLSPLHEIWAHTLARKLPDASVAPVLEAGWQKIAAWLGRPDPDSDTAKKYVQRTVRALVQAGVLEPTGVKAGRGRRARYRFHTSGPFNGRGGHVGVDVGGQNRLSTEDHAASECLPNVSQSGPHTMPLERTQERTQEPSGQLALPGDWTRPCLDGEKAPTTAASQHRNTANFSTTSCDRWTRQPMRSRRPVHAEQPEGKPMRRRSKQPTLFDVPAPVVAAAQPGDATAHVIVGEWLSRCSVRPQSRIIGQVGKLIKEALAEGIDADSIRAGMAVWMRSGRPPVVLTAMIHEQQTLRHPPASDDAGVVRSGRDRVVGEWLDWSARLEAAEARGPQWAVGA